MFTQTESYTAIPLLIQLRFSTRRRRHVIPELLAELAPPSPPSFQMDRPRERDTRPWPTYQPFPPPREIYLLEFGTCWNQRPAADVPSGQTGVVDRRLAISSLVSSRWPGHMVP